jgi:amidase
MRHDEYLAHDATALAAALRRGDTNATETLSLALEQHARLQARLRCTTTLLEAQARERIAQGLPLGPLQGVPFLMKDSLADVAGLPTSHGSRSMRHWTPQTDSHVTRRYLQAGLLLFGRSNLPEFGLKGVSDSEAFGRVSNPWDTTRTAGGSSGGSAAAVAAGIVPIASGTDGGGSLRIPASYCGLFALKPGRGRISDGPTVGEVWYGACAQGVITRSVRDTAIALDILCGPEAGDPVFVPAPSERFVDAIAQAPRRLRIGFSTASPIGTPVHADAVRAVQETAKLLQSLGHELEPASPPVDGAALAKAFIHLYFGQIPAAVAAAKASGARDEEFELLTRVMATLGAGVHAGTMTVQLMQWNLFARQLGAFHQRFDFWLSPSVAGPAPLHGSGDPPPSQQRLLKALLATGVLKLLASSGLMNATVDTLARDSLKDVPFTQLANLTGTPAMSVPLHSSAEGLPIGVQFTGRQGEEALMLQLAAQLEQAAPWFERLPAIAKEASGRA